MQAQQAGQEAAEDEEDVGWQDSDSQGIVNEWETEEAVEDLEQDHNQAEPAIFTEQHQQQQQQPQMENMQQLAEYVAGNPPQQPVQQQAMQATQHELQQQPQEQRQDEQRRLLRQQVAALFHDRVVVLLRQQLARHHAGQQPTVVLDEGIAMRLLHQARREAAAAAGPSGSSDADGSDSNTARSGTAESMQNESSGDTASDGCTWFDPNVTASHTYLGDVDELEGVYGHLPPGTPARLPLLMLDGVVLFPGCQLPLLLSTSADQRLLDRALAAAPPLTRLLAVMPGWRTGMVLQPHMVCCTVEVRQMRRQETDGAVAVLALGRQRAEVVDDRHLARSQTSVQVRILSEGCQSSVPHPMRCYASAIHPALTAPWDLRLLVNRVRQLIQVVLIPVASFQGSPLELSYWVSHNLPLQPSTRQLLLRAGSPAERLRLLVGLLERLDQLSCSSCGAVLATTADVLAMTSEGIAGTFVNSAGYVHEMVTFRRVRGVQLEGRPETAHSWFPGYAWTIAYCRTCGQHLGWRFTATLAHLSPRVFWGLRRPVLTCQTRPQTAVQEVQGVQDPGQQQQTEGHRGGWPGPVVIPLQQLPARLLGNQEPER